MFKKYVLIFLFFIYNSWKYKLNKSQKNFRKKKEEVLSREKNMGNFDRNALLYLMFFIGSRIVNVSAAYPMLLSTYRMNGLSALEYLKKFFHEIVKRRKDYENLLSMTIKISTNRY